MILALLLQAAAPQTAVEAERAFNAMAQAEGQWTAFRAFAADDAVMFTPRPVNVQAFLEDRKDPPIAVQWWPAASYRSCDGKAAVNTGPWVRPQGNGYFTTVWQRRDGGWKWALDHGDALSTPRPLPASPRSRRAACGGTPTAMIFPKQGDGESGGGAAPDGTLVWHWQVAADGARVVRAFLWNGRGFDTVIDDRIEATR